MGGIVPIDQSRVEVQAGAQRCERFIAQGIALGFRVVGLIEVLENEPA